MNFPYGEIDKNETILFTDFYFEKNRASTSGGAILMACFIDLNQTLYKNYEKFIMREMQFVDNWSGMEGGAIMIDN
jgi:predicted outer membrane repeat protein